MLKRILIVGLVFSLSMNLSFAHKKRDDVSQAIVNIEGTNNFLTIYNRENDSQAFIAKVDNDNVKVGKVTLPKRIDKGRLDEIINISNGKMLALMSNDNGKANFAYVISYDEKSNEINLLSKRVELPNGYDPTITYMGKAGVAREINYLLMVTASEKEDKINPKSSKLTARIIILEDQENNDYIIKSSTYSGNHGSPVITIPSYGTNPSVAFFKNKDPNDAYNATASLVFEQEGTGELFGYPIKLNSNGNVYGVYLISPAVYPTIYPFGKGEDPSLASKESNIEIVSSKLPNDTAQVSNIGYGETSGIKIDEWVNLEFDNVEYPSVAVSNNKTAYEALAFSNKSKGNLVIFKKDDKGNVKYLYKEKLVD